MQRGRTRTSRRAAASVAFAADLRRTGRLKQLRWNFCAQVANYREMPDFVRFALDNAVDMVHFAALVKIWCHTDEWFTANSVASAGHPLHEEYLRVLADPALSHPAVIKTTL